MKRTQTVQSAVHVHLQARAATRRNLGHQLALVTLATGALAACGQPAAGGPATAPTPAAAGPGPSASGGITLDAATVVRPYNPLIGGTNINAHTQFFADDDQTTTDPATKQVVHHPMPFREDLKAAGLKFVRLLAYPDRRTYDGTHLADPAWFDTKIQAVLSAGAVPVLQLNLAASNYLDAGGQPSAAGTPQTDIVALVKRYMAAPFNLQTQYWQVHNEPDLTIDGQQTAAGYAQAFRAVNDALVAAGLRSHVVLAGPVISYGYHEPWFGSDADPTYQLRHQILETFLQQDHDIVDVVDVHGYSNEGSGPFDLLNMPRHVENKFDANRAVTPGQLCNTGDNVSNANCPDADRGLAGIVRLMQQAGVRPGTRLAVSEFNAGKQGKSLAQGLWNLEVLHFLQQNASPYPTAYSNNFIFDSFTDGYGLYDTPDAGSTIVKTPAYWALWMRGNLTGARDVLSVQSSGHLNPYGNPYLLASATADAGHIYLQVINRCPCDISVPVTIRGAAVGPTSELHVLAQGVTPDQASTGPGGSTFGYDFPPFSATVFKLSKQ